MMNSCEQRTRAGRFIHGSDCDFSALRDVVARFIWLEGAKAEADAAIAAKQRAAVFIVDPFHVILSKDGSEKSNCIEHEHLPTFPKQKLPVSAYVKRSRLQQSASLSSPVTD
jgi:hypothetical protein